MIKLEKYRCRIPSEVIEVVKDRIGNFPSQFDIEYDVNTLYDTLKSKTKLWNYDKVDDGGNKVYRASLIEYDGNGIYVYISSENISILYLTSLKNNVDFMVNSLIKQKNKTK